MREKDLQKLYECEFPIMERLITEKQIFQKRLEDKPIFIVTSNASKEQKDDMTETFWRTGVYRPMGLDEIDEFGYNSIVTYTIHNRWASKVYGGLNNYEKTRVGQMFNIPMDDWKKRYHDWVTKINK